MTNDDRTKIIPRRTPESAAMAANIKRAMAITTNLNRLTYNDADEVRALFSNLIGKKVDDSFLLIPPFYTTGGPDISVGRRVTRSHCRSGKGGDRTVYRTLNTRLLT